MKKLLSFIILLLLTGHSPCCLAKSNADTSNYKPRYAIHIDMALNILNEKNVGAEIRLSHKISVGATYARVLPSYYLSDHIFVASHHHFPTRIFDGFAFKGFVKCYFENNNYKNKNNDYYIQFTALFKNAGYGYNYVFDGAGDKGSLTSERTNETAKIYGAYLTVGQEMILAKYAFIDLFFGLAYRYRIRNYTTISSVATKYWGSPEPLGTFTVHQHYFAPVIGLKLGFCYQKKK